MPIEMNRKQESNQLLQFLEIIFYRMVALFLLYSAITYWIRVLGIQTGPETRFDLMSEHWQIAAVVMCVVLPVAALGLWGRFPWGVFVWFVAIATELTMYLGFPQLFGTRDSVILFHAASFGLYLIFRLLELMMANKG